MSGGVYIYRTRTPWNLRWWRHFAYVGETSSFHHRHMQHVVGGGRFNADQKPWADLSPTVYRVPLPDWKWLRLAVETLAIVALWPAYNVQKNRWNPRRIRQASARQQRALRDRWGWSPDRNIVWPLLVVALLVAWLVSR